jgi:ubiquinone/menaquinone biosynthesis C-methylase UbiE
MDREATRRDVRATYEQIADHFSKTREYAWPEVESFLEDTEKAPRALDVGCGNGRHAELLATVASEVVALDASRGLLREARERIDAHDSVSLVQGDASGLPLSDDCIDVAVYVATLHHLPTRDDRRRSLDELARVLASNGRALVSAWSIEHDRFDHEGEDGFDTTIDWTLPGGEVVPRFYHIYAPAEFRADVAASALTLEDFEISSGNCYAVVRPEGKRP